MVQQYLHELNSMVPAEEESDYELAIEIKIVVEPYSPEKLHRVEIINFG
jgi:hypothetical protein